MYHASPPNIFSVMTVPAEQISSETAENVARDHWGIVARASLLTGERDRNFHLTADSGDAYVLKFANPAEDPAVTNLQITALLHIAERDPGFPVPRIVPLPSGAAEVRLPRPDGTIQRIRLLSWVPGVPLHQARRSRVQRMACGTALARLGIALRDFNHPASRHPLIWDVAHFPRLREVVDTLDDASARGAIAGVLDEFGAKICPILPALRYQIVHNDMNTGNTLVDTVDHDRFAGLIDFGDMVETALAVDVAVGATAQINPDMDLIEAMAVFVAGYHAMNPLSAEEVSVLPLLITARMCMSVVLPAWHRSVHPNNPHYERMDKAEIARRLRQIATVRTSETAATLSRACGL